MIRFVPPYMSAVLVLLALASTARAEGGSMDAWAQWALAPKVWKGQTVAAPEPTPRPRDLSMRLDSLRLPLSVHVGARSSQLQAERALAALEAAYDALAANGWPLPIADGGYGETPGFDLYLTPAAPARAAAFVDALVPWSDFDSAQTYAVIDADLPDDALFGCVQSALTQAALRGVDPAEAESWVRASGELTSWLFTGEPGCDDSFAAAQRDASGALLSPDPDSAAAGALLLAMLDERRAGGDGSFVRGLWETTRQRSSGLVAPDRLRSSPDLWEALNQTLAVDHLQLLDELSEFGVARYFAGDAQRRSHAGYRVLASLPETASVPIASEVELEDLPRHLHDNSELQQLGSAYVRVKTAGAGNGADLQVWLKGEIGPQWSLYAVRLGADGLELGRTSAPARKVPSSYLPVAFGPDTAEILLVITSLPASTPDADDNQAPPHGYELILARGP
jgi:hypothetical protein